MPEPNTTNILREKREERGMILAEVAAFVGLTASRISALEHITSPDQRARVGAIATKRMAVLYGMTEDEIKRIVRGLPPADQAPATTSNNPGHHAAYPHRPPDREPCG